MTEEGEKTSETVQAVAKSLRSEIAADVSSQDLAMALDVMRRLSANLQNLASGRAQS
jgi:MarR family transcriptional regulator for hemolysin